MAVPAIALRVLSSAQNPFGLSVARNMKTHTIEFSYVEGGDLERKFTNGITIEVDGASGNVVGIATPEEHYDVTVLNGRLMLNGWIIGRLISDYCTFSKAL